MSTSSRRQFLSEILSDKPIPLGKLAYFRERFRDRLYELVLKEFLKSEASGLTRADIARRIGRRPEQITRWLGAPGNWTLETVSDLLLAISKAEPEVGLLPLEGRIVRNYVGQDSSDTPVRIKSDEPQSAESANDPLLKGGSATTNPKPLSKQDYPRNRLSKDDARLGELL